MPGVRRAFRQLPVVVKVALLVATVAAAGYTARLAAYMVDERRTHYSVLDREFFRNHSCLSSYTEAARLAPTGANIFDPRVYALEPSPGELAPRSIGTFEVDLYQYPPAFLILPLGLEGAGLDFFQVRTVWFAIQFAVLAGGLLVTARWIGGSAGAIAALCIPLLFLTPTTRLSLQIGNFQATALPLAVLAMIAFERSRTVLGGAALGFCAASKIFPGVLGIVLLVQRRWAAAGSNGGRRPGSPRVCARRRRPQAFC